MVFLTDCRERNSRKLFFLEKIVFSKKKRLREKEKTWEPILFCNETSSLTSESLVSIYCQNLKILESFGQLPKIQMSPPFRDGGSTKIQID